MPTVMMFLRGAVAGAAMVIGLERSSPLRHFPAESETVTREQPLVTIVSEPEGNLAREMSLRLGADGQILQVVISGPPEVIVIESGDLWVRDVASAWANGRQVVFLSCLGCDFKRGGGAVRVRYLHNGITGGFDTALMRIERRDARWELFSAEAPSRPITRLRLESRKWLGLLIGIARVLFE